MHVGLIVKPEHCAPLLSIVPISSHNTFYSHAASEWKYLLYYIPVTLYGILLDALYVHILLLVKAIRLLLGSRVSKDDVEIAEKLLKKFAN